MHIILRRASPLLALVAVAACSEAATDPLASAAPATKTVIGTERWNMADVEADFAGVYSLDTTQAGSNATFYVAPVDAVTGDRTFCRDHFKPIDLWWDGGYGVMSFHIDPPLLFVGYRAGTYTSPRNLVFRRAVFETLGESEARDPAGNVWRFQGRFNALCRGGELELGPVVFGGQLLVAQDPLTRPVLVRRGSGDDDECGGANGDDYHYMESYDPYAPEPADAVSSCGTNGGSTFNPEDYVCHWEHITIEISYDGGQTWQEFWSGWAQVCDNAE